MKDENFNKIANLKVGNYVRCNKNSYDDVGNHWDDLMKPMLDGKYRKILSVGKIYGNVDLKIEGLQTTGLSKLWNYDFCDLDVIVPEEYKQINENYVFKVGDWVSYERYFKGAKQIEEIIDDQAIIKNVSIMSFSLNNLTLVCGFNRGDEVECAFDESFMSYVNCEFYAYEPTLKQPFIVIGKETRTVSNMPYCRRHVIR